MTEKLCFLVSPIGNEGSEVRRHADTVRWIVRNALAKFGFHTVRFDETSFGKFVEIQPECVHLVETADFSVIVLTGRYPNVLYEAGRRHACGKPYLQLLQEGDLNPIKLPGARTISYRNIETTDGAAKLTLEIEEYMKIYGNQDVAAGFQRSAAYAKDKLNATEGILNWGTLNMLAPGTKQVNQSGGITLGDGSTVIGGNFVVANSIKDSFHNVELIYYCYRQDD
jgi:hypothetical protein